jgi:hypothetical protein
MNIGEIENRQRENNGGIFGPMKTINRMALGTISSLLLSAGLARAAQKLDPLSKSARNFGFCAKESPANSCTLPCLYQAD